MKVTKRQLNFCTIFHLLLDPNIYQIINEPSDKMYIKDVYQVCTIYSCRDRGVETPGGEGGGGGQRITITCHSLFISCNSQA